MSATSSAAVDELRTAAALLHQHASGNPLPMAVAALLAAQAKHWEQWFPAAPTALDRTAAQLAKAVIATYSSATKPPDADAGPRQHQTPTKG